MNEELKADFLDFGALSYSDSKIKSILDVSDQQLQRMYDDGARIAYSSGADRFNFAVDRKLMQLAASGDIKALQKLESRRAKNKT